MENCRDFYEEFQEVAKAAGGADILIDFSQIRFIDSSGIGILLKCSQEMKQEPRNLLIHGLNRQLTSVFKLAGLLKVFQVVEEDAARERFPEIF